MITKSTIEQQLFNWEEAFENHVCAKGLISKISKKIIFIFLKDGYRMREIVSDFFNLLIPPSWPGVQSFLWISLVGVGM